MLRENAFVVGVDDEIAWVETQRKSSCDSCQSKNSCGTSVLQRVLGNKRTRLKVNNPNHYAVGDEVILGLREDALVKGSLLLYTLPLVAMFSFALLAKFLFQIFDLEITEGYSILSALLGLAAGFWFVFISSQKLINNTDYQATILEKVVSIRSLHEKI